MSAYKRTTLRITDRVSNVLEADTLLHSVVFEVLINGESAGGIVELDVDQARALIAYLDAFLASAPQPAVLAVEEE